MRVSGPLGLSCIRISSAVAIRSVLLAVNSQFASGLLTRFFERFRGDSRGWLYPDNAGQNQQIDGGCPGVPQSPGARFRRRAGRQDVIDQQNPGVGCASSPSGMKGERSGDIALALAATEM